MRGDEPTNEPLKYRLPYPPPFRCPGVDTPEPPVLEPDPEPGGLLNAAMNGTHGPDLAGFPVVLLNGPPRSGKDTAANGLLMANPGAVLMRFSAPLKASTHALFGLPIDPDRYEAAKDTPSTDFMGLTPRQAYIAVSEQAVKRTFGKAFFGRVMVARMGRQRHALQASDMPWPPMAVCPDSGFSIETAPVIRAVGSANVILIRVHRPGFDFARDSRSYISLEHVHTVDVHNTGTVADLQRAVCDAVTKWLTLPM